MIEQDLVTEIRNKVDIVDIVGERIPLVAKGKNFFGVCPFHDDTNPSMSVSREKQIYTCFSCGASGNVFNFIMDYEKMDFRETLKYLGEKVGVNTSNIRISRENTKYSKFYEAYKLASKYYQNNLMTSVGKIARDYLKNRGITETIIKEFEIGLSLSSRDDLTTLLHKKDYELSTLNRIGLSVDDRDIYIDRIMFPLYDTLGKIVGFSGRVYKAGDDKNKYLNTKETDIFKKGETLYHYHIAKEEARVKKAVIVMEGFMDVIRASTIGIKNTVALMGTALTDAQVKLLKRLSPNIILCLDGDGPGRKATLSVGEQLLKAGVEVKVVALPTDDDPDTYILREGQNRFRSLVENALFFADYKIKALKENINLNSDLEISNYVNRVLEEASTIEDDIRVEIILKKLAKEFDLGYNTLEKRFQGMKKKEVPVNIPTPKKKTKRKSSYEQAVEQIIYYMLTNEWTITQVEKEHIIFPTEESRIMVNEIIYYYEKYGKISIADFYTYLQGKERLLILLNQILAGNYNEQATKDTLFDYFEALKRLAKKEYRKQIKTNVVKEVDEIEQAKISDEMRRLRIGD